MPVVIPACSPAGRDLLCNNVSQTQYFRPVTPMRKLDLNKKGVPVHGDPELYPVHKNGHCQEKHGTFLLMRSYFIGRRLR